MPAASPLVTGLTARLVGAIGGTVERDYWVSALYLDGSRSGFAGPATVFNTPASLGGGFQSQSGVQNVGTGSFVLIQWNPSPGAVSYDIVCTGSSTIRPIVAGNQAVAIGVSVNGIADVAVGTPGSVGYLPYAPRTQAYQAVAMVRYDFLNDGGAIGTLIPIASEPPFLGGGAVITGFYVKTLVTVTGGTGATIAIGVPLGIASFLAATPIASFTAGGPTIVGIPTPAVPLTLIPGGQATRVAVTIAGAALTAGSFEIIMPYFFIDQ